MYDGDGNRVKTTIASGGTGGTYALETYTYTVTGNLTNKAALALSYPANSPATGCVSGTPTTKAHAAYSASGGGNSYAYTYDCNGNVTQRTVNGTAYNLTYDTENRLTGVSGGATATFVYDGDGNRVKTTIAGTTTAYVGNYYELTGSAFKKYYYAGSTRVALNDNGTLKWLLGDHLGSTSLTADGATGALLTELRYKPWGENRYTSGSTPTTYRFTGQRQEAALGGAEGLYYFGARWYDPATSRFLQADSIVPGAGNPQALNRYSFVLGNPLRYTDPSGHEPCETGEGLACSGGSRNSIDDGYRHNSNTWQRRLNRWIWQQRSKWSGPTERGSVVAPAPIPVAPYAPAIAPAPQSLPLGANATSTIQAPTSTPAPNLTLPGLLTPEATRQATQYATPRADVLVQLQGPANDPYYDSKPLVDLGDGRGVTARQVQAALTVLYNAPRFQPYLNDRAFRSAATTAVVSASAFAEACAAAGGCPARNYPFYFPGYKPWRFDIVIYQGVQITRR